MAQLINNVEFEGLYDAMDVLASTRATVELDAVELLKRASKPVWLEDGSNLAYTITARNLDDRAPGAQDPGLPLTGVVIEDTIDTSIAQLVDGSLTLTIGEVSVDPVESTYVDGVLTVQVGTIPPGQTATLSFLVERVS